MSGVQGDVAIRDNVLQKEETGQKLFTFSFTGANESLISLQKSIVSNSQKGATVCVGSH